MNDLKDRSDILITKADKGGAVVIMDVKDYINEANRQLGNTHFYKSVDEDLTHKHNNVINTSIDKYIEDKI